MRIKFVKKLPEVVTYDAEITHTVTTEFKTIGVFVFRITAVGGWGAHVSVSFAGVKVPFGYLIKKDFLE